MKDPIVIVSSARTPMGGLQGSLSFMSASQLGAVAIKAAVKRAAGRAGRRPTTEHPLHHHQ